MTNSRTIFFDVTQLVHRSGNLTGIPRVTHELATRFQNLGAQRVRFVSWVKDLRAYCEIDLERSLKQRGQGVVYLKASDVNVSSSNTLAKRGAKNVAKMTIAGTRKINNRAASFLESRIRTKTLSSYKKVQFSKEDIVFIPWGEWWDTSFTDYLVNIHHEQNVKLVQIIHDMATITQAQFFETVSVNPESYNQQILPICSLVLVPSQNTKNEMLTWLKNKKLTLPTVSVFREGDDFKVANTVMPKDPKFISSGLKGGDFILCVGTIEAKKNHRLLYYVYKLASSRKIKLPKLVIVGRPGYGTKMTIELLTHDQEIANKFVLLTNTTDEELSWLYEHCMFTILPSFHEGWGIPIAESVARGVPCLCSNTSSMVEIAEGIVEHFSPASTDECLSAIVKWLDPINLSAAQTKTKQYAKHSWDKSFKQVLTAVEEIK